MAEQAGLFDAATAVSGAVPVAVARSSHGRASDDPSERVVEHDEDSFNVPPLRASDLVLEDSFASRRDSLLRTVPLHDVVERVRRSEDLDPAFDARALCLAAFDAVIARQGFPDSATVEDVLGVLTEIASVQAPTSTAHARGAVAEAVLDGLMNRRGRNRRFELETVAYSRDRTGAARGTTVQQQFWLLRAIEDPATGRTTLEASADAVNMLVGGLNIPIADNQRAAQIMLGLQLERGDIAAAASTAARNRTLTVGYLNETDELLRRTAQFVAGAGWDAAASERLDAALTHLQTCLSEESRALSHVRQGRDDEAAGSGRNADSARAGGAGGGMDARRRARYFAQLTQLLEESRSLHTALLERVLGARSAFLAAQDAQLFRPAITTFDLDLTADVLTPVLALDLADAERVLDAYLVAELGPQVPRVVSWGDLVDALLSRPEAKTEPDEPAADVAFRADPAPLVDAALVARTRELVTSVALPCRLSTLLAACPDEGHDGAQPHDIVVAAALHAYNVIGGDRTEAGTAAGTDLRLLGDLDADSAVWRPASTADPARLADALARKALAVLGEDAVCLDDGIRLAAPFAGADLLVCADPPQAHEVFLGVVPTPQPAVLPERATRSHR
jgi:hypothetical protein